jgi:hypothetical protein
LKIRLLDEKSDCFDEFFAIVPAQAVAVAACQPMPGPPLNLAGVRLTCHSLLGCSKALIDFEILVERVRQVGKDFYHYLE